MRRLYGTSPLHLLAHLALLPLCAWALLEILGGRSASRIALWLVAAVMVHDLVVLPLYSSVDRVAQSALRGVVNYFRIVNGRISYMANFHDTVPFRPIMPDA